ncbi:hypothetical protein DFH06DRAFT_284663 [Mycena polygramma]|nr:hypothetical protein DFH06DRAFT_284663 [Mycena polygramma]
MHGRKCCSEHSFYLSMYPDLCCSFSSRDPCLRGHMLRPCGYVVPLRPLFRARVAMLCPSGHYSARVALFRARVAIIPPDGRYSVPEWPFSPCHCGRTLCPSGHCTMELCPSGHFAVCCARVAILRAFLNCVQGMGAALPCARYSMCVSHIPFIHASAD